MDIQRVADQSQREKAAPVVWEQACLEEVCGSCSMLINGRPRQACTALIKGPILKESCEFSPFGWLPCQSFLSIRDLACEPKTHVCSIISGFRGGVEADGIHMREGLAPSKTRKCNICARYVLPTCMTCGCCLEACPQWRCSLQSMGPAVDLPARASSTPHPTGNNASPRAVPCPPYGKKGGRIQ